MINRLLALAFAGSIAAQAPPPQWELQYLFDEDESELTILDLKFPSARRGIASVVITRESSRKYGVLLTSDGGKKWDLVPVKEPGLSLFFINESLGWKVTPNGIWRTEEFGRSWRKQKSPGEVRRLYFLDEQRGYALCSDKAVYETADGGVSWKLLPASREVAGDRNKIAYESIDFVGTRGMITGWSEPVRFEPRLPDWMNPEQAARRRELPVMSIVLETIDGGKNWKAATSSMFGRISKIDLAPDGRGLALMEFRNAFEAPSEVVAIDLKTGASAGVFKKADRKVTDVLLIPGGAALLAAVETPPRLSNAPVPGRLRILRSDDLKQWLEMRVDYRAEGVRAILAAADSSNVWVAASSGSILKLRTPEQ